MNEYKTLEKYLEGGGAQRFAWKPDYPLSRCCTFKIGGNADYVIYPRGEHCLGELIDFFEEIGIKYIVLGNASNILFSDNGFRGAVVFTSRLKCINVDGDMLEVQSGAALTSAALAAQKNGLAGLEFAYGIPGSCGGAIYMNAGAFGGEIKDILVSGTYYDPKKAALTTINGSEHRFGYRSSIYNENGGVIIKAVFKLRRDDPTAVRQRMDTHMKYRVDNQPLDYPSAGSVFKRYPGYYTSKLIEEAGLKGTRVGGAQVSEKHAGFIINLGCASCGDVLELIKIIKETIYKKNGINIECELKYIAE